MVCVVCIACMACVACVTCVACEQRVRALRARGMYVVALETTEDALPLGVAPQLGDEDKGVAVVLGNEVTGVDKAVLDVCDAIVEIPVFGVKNSLNVATAASILMWEALRQWGEEAAKSEK